MIRSLFARLIFSLSACCMCSGFASAADRTVAGKMDEPLEISLSASDALSQWSVADYPESLVEPAGVQRLPAETVFLFRPRTIGQGSIRFVKRASGGAEMLAYEVDVMITGTQPLDIPAAPAERPEPGLPQARPDRLPAPAAKSGGDRSIWADPLFSRMLHGRLGFPAKNPPPMTPTDTEIALRKLNPLPYDLSYVLPEGSYLNNPTHKMPLPDTPPGVDVVPPAYHQALELARRGLFAQASGVLDEMVADMTKGGKKVPAAILSFYRFVNAHIQMELRQYPEAVTRFRALFEDRDFGLGSRFYAALATERNGDTLGAVTAYQGVISYDPGGYFTPEAAYRIAQIFLRAEAYERAIEEYKSFIRNYPRSPFIDDTVFDLATIYDQIYEHQDFDLALNLYDRILTDYGESVYVDTAASRKKFVLENFF
ncbi:tetratricopeptide repeat protein [bacterium]|nr:tetratricopeptide repeat protein [bacterium]